MFALQFLGGGRMAEALLGGLLAAGAVPVADVSVVEVLDERRAELVRLHPGLHVTDVPESAADVVVATKPGQVAQALAAARDAGLQRVLSIAAGITIASLEAAAGPVPVVRAMPNTPALVGEGASAIAAGTRAGPADLDWAEGLLGTVGTVVRVPEDQLDAVTALSGSGPAYLFLVAEALIDAGVRAGLPADTADALARQTVLGSARLLARGGDPADLRAAVTSPGGTTAAAVRVLEDLDLRGAFAAAVDAAAERSRELGG
ncbi:MAG: pyrroline-5-carboxylate reductase [Microthrixaceae bacterium]